MFKFNKNKKCKHKWIPGFIKGEINGVSIKFIGCYCERCRIGHDELLSVVGTLTKQDYATYSEEYFNK
jgi:hypothetical protein